MPTRAKLTADARAKILNDTRAILVIAKEYEVSPYTIRNVFLKEKKPNPDKIIVPKVDRTGYKTLTIAEFVQMRRNSH